MTTKPRENIDPDFSKRRQNARIEINKLDRDRIHDEPERDRFFNSVYDRAGDDAAQIPWADMAAKPQISNWLVNNSGEGQKALDIACGLGDNAEEIAGAGYQTTAFDLSDSAINWARERFPDTKVNYQVANLFEPPSHWKNGFDLVNECYTLQALPPQMLEKSQAAIANLVRPGGQLLVYIRLRPDNIKPKGPPWPLSEGDAMKFQQLGFELIDDERFVITRSERKIPHQFAHWRKLA